MKIKLLKCFPRENLNYIQVDNGHLEFEIKVTKADNTNFIVAADNTKEVLRLINKAFAFTIHDARISTSAGTEIEQNNIVAPVPTKMGLITERVLSTHFNIIEENEVGINNSSLKQILINNHTDNVRRCCS